VRRDTATHYDRLLIGLLRVARNDNEVIAGRRSRRGNPVDALRIDGLFRHAVACNDDNEVIARRHSRRGNPADGLRIDVLLFYAVACKNLDWFLPTPQAQNDAGLPSMHTDSEQLVICNGENG
jgi:hypothetical protein